MLRLGLLEPFKSNREGLCVGLEIRGGFREEVGFPQLLKAPVGVLTAKGEEQE